MHIQRRIYTHYIGGNEDIANIIMLGNKEEIVNKYNVRCIGFRYVLSTSQRYICVYEINVSQCLVLNKFCYICRNKAERQSSSLARAATPCTREMRVFLFKYKLAPLLLSSYYADDSLYIHFLFLSLSIVCASVSVNNAFFVKH